MKTTLVSLSLLCLLNSQSHTQAAETGPASDGKATASSVTAKSTGKLELVAGQGSADATTGSETILRGPFGVDFDSKSNLYVVEMSAGRVLKMDQAGRWQCISGTGEKGYAGDGGPAAAAQYNGLHNLAIAPNDDVYLSDTWNNRVRKIDAKTGQVSTVAGNGTKGYSGDGGPATEASCGGIYCVSLDPQGTNLYLADLDNRRIRAVDLRTGIIRTVAGNGRKGIPSDGVLATAAPLVDPRAVIADGRGNIYILERSGHALRVVDAEGKIRTLVGSGQAGSSGDDGPARAALLNGPKHLCFDRAGDVIIADAENHLIRKYVLKTDRLVRVAGTGKKGRRGLGMSPLDAELNQPHGVYVHPSGILFISDSSNNRILKVTF